MSEEKELQEENKTLEEQTIEEMNEVEKVEESTEVKEEPYNGPVVKVNTRYDYRTMKYFNMYNMMYRKHFQVVYILMGLLSAAFGGYTCFQALSQDTINPMNFVLPVIFVLFGVYFVYQALCFEKVIDKNITMHFYKNPKVVNIGVTVTEEKVTLQIMGNKTGEPFDYDWAYVNEIVEIPQFFFLYVGKQPIIIEKDPNRVTEGDYDTLVNIIMDKTSTKPYKKLEKDLVTKPITYVHQEDIKDDMEEAEVVEEDVKENEETKEE